MNESTTSRAVPDPMTPPTTPLKAEALILKHLRARYPRSLWKTIRSGEWHVSMQHVLMATDTLFTVQGEVAGHSWNERDEDTIFEVDVLAGACTCTREAGVPCEHLFAAAIFAQMSALDRAYRATHEDVCRKRWCTLSREWASKDGLCWRHHKELRDRFEWSELQELRQLRDRLNGSSGAA